MDSSLKDLDIFVSCVPSELSSICKKISIG